MYVRLIIFSTLILGSLGGGCTPRYTKPLQREPATQEERNFQRLWESARTVLKKYSFPLDRQDRRDGIITTEAVAGGHLFEFWRKDAATVFSYKENTVQTIMRAARVTIHRLEDSKDEFDFKVEVLMARTNRPQPQLTSSSQTMRMPTSRLGRLKFDDLRYERQAAGEGNADRRRDLIVPLGRDSDLESYIADDIRNAAAAYEPQGGAWITP
ncbi:MAG TPA: outer membrane protein assembly factor BamC [Phycisphaerae bacterium]|nr:outer membrane protein assembly factor BamC [Phycisphaerae bacterium]